MLSRQAFRTARAAAPVFRAPAAVRTYAAAAATESSAQPPIAVFGVDGTYASALVCKIRTPTEEEKGRKRRIGPSRRDQA